MIQLVNEIISTILQIGLFTLIPFIFFLFRKDKTLTFFRYIGLYRPPAKSFLFVLLTSFIFLVAGIGLIFIDESIKQAVLSPNSVTGKLRLMELSATTMAILLIISLLKTSLSEEILFRGFIAKRLVNKLGFKNGNFLQAVIFGLVHLLLFWQLTETSTAQLIFILIFSSFAGWAIGYVKEKYADGSIVPGWAAHGLGNTLSYFIIAFVI